MKDFTDTGSGAATTVGMAKVRYRATNYVCKSSDDLLTAFAPIATTPASVATDNNGNGTGHATFDLNASGAKRFYRVEEL